MYLSELNRKSPERRQSETQETVLEEGRVADGGARKPSVLKELKRRQEKIKMQEEQKKRGRQAVKECRSNDAEL